MATNAGSFGTGTVQDASGSIITSKALQSNDLVPAVAAFYERVSLENFGINYNLMGFADQQYDLEKGTYMLNYGKPVKVWDSMERFLNYGEVGDGFDSSQAGTNETYTKASDYDIPSDPNEHQVPSTTHIFDQTQFITELVNKRDMLMNVTRLGAYVALDEMEDFDMPNDVGFQKAKQLGQHAGYMTASLFRSEILAGATAYTETTIHVDNDTHSSWTSLADDLQNAAKNLKHWGAGYISSYKEGADKIGTSPLKSSYYGLIHSDLETYFEQALSGNSSTDYLPLERYAQQKNVHKDEIGQYNKLSMVQTDFLRHTKDYYVNTVENNAGNFDLTFNSEEEANSLGSGDELFLYTDSGTLKTQFVYVTALGSQSTNKLTNVSLEDESGTSLDGATLTSSGAYMYRTQDSPDFYDRQAMRLRKYNLLAFGKKAFASIGIKGEKSHGSFELIYKKGSGTSDPINISQTAAYKCYAGGKVLRPAHLYKFPLKLQYEDENIS